MLKITQKGIESILEQAQESALRLIPVTSSFYLLYTLP
jgi:hypothetical protein